MHPVKKALIATGIIIGVATTVIVGLVVFTHFTMLPSDPPCRDRGCRSTDPHGDRVLGAVMFAIFLNAIPWAAALIPTWKYEPKVKTTK